MQQVVIPPQPPPPDVISRVTAAKKIFVSNAGADTGFAHDIPGGANVTYNEFYAALEQWGYFQLVNSATQADLIFQIQGTEELPDIEHTGTGGKNKDYTATLYPPMLNLSILDPSQLFLYSIVIPAGRGSNKAKGAIAFTQSIDALRPGKGSCIYACANTKSPSAHLAK
jgi:hypothetical protein